MPDITDNLLPSPLLSESPNGPAQILALAEALRAAPVLHSTGSTGAIPSTPILPGGLIPYVGLTVINFNTAVPAEVKAFRCIDTAPVRWLERDWNMPWGEVAAVVSTAVSQSGITAVTDITGMTATWTAVANRKYRTLGQCNMGSTVATDQIALVVSDGAGGQLARADCLGTASPHVLLRETGVSAGSTTRKLRAVRITGTGTISTAALAGVPATLVVEDIGPNGQPA